MPNGAGTLVRTDRASTDPIAEGETGAGEWGDNRKSEGGGPPKLVAGAVRAYVDVDGYTCNGVLPIPGSRLSGGVRINGAKDRPSQVSKSNRNITRHS